MLADEALVDDELRRTQVFIVTTGALALVGTLASWLFDGHSGWRAVFAASSTFLLVAYASLWWHVRDTRRYLPTHTVAAVTLCSLAGVAACFFYGLFSPAPMILTLPVAFVGRTLSGPGARLAYAVAAASVGAPMLLLAFEALPDPGLVRAEALGTGGRLVYAGLVQAVLVTCLVNARGSRRVTEAVVRRLAAARQEAERRDAQLEEVNQRLDDALRTGRPGPMTGSRVGAWTLRGLLGRGAMGDVYGAVRDGDAREAAVKVLSPAVAEDEHALALIRREASLLGRVANPHVVQLIEVATGDPPWIAMEWLRGPSLAEILRHDQRLPTEEVDRLATQVGAGLDAAARVNVMHRDLKPSNICLADTTSGARWKILDFGVAKHLGDDLTVTRGNVVGTPGYIPPESLLGRPVDARGDVWSLAAITYRALTGAPPFPGRRHALLRSTVEAQPVRPSAWVAVPPGVDAVLAVGLAKRPQARFSTGGEFAAALHGALAGGLPAGVEERAAAILVVDPWRTAPDHP